MAVPTVFLDGEEFASGRQTIEQLLEKAAGPTSKDDFAERAFRCFGRRWRTCRWKCSDLCGA